MLKLTIKPISISQCKDQFEIQVGSDMIVGEVAQLVMFDRVLEGVDPE